jgi:hypothetical protein
MTEPQAVTTQKPATAIVLKRGDFVLYQNNYDPEPCPALITHVWVKSEDQMLNLTVFDRDGEARAATRIARGRGVGTWRPVGTTE